MSSELNSVVLRTYLKGKTKDINLEIWMDTKLFPTNAGTFTQVQVDPYVFL